MAVSSVPPIIDPQILQSTWHCRSGWASQGVTLSEVLCDAEGYALPGALGDHQKIPLELGGCRAHNRQMCRNIRPLFNFAPPATEEEIRAAALQYVRKVSGVQKPSQANQAEFERAVDEVAGVTRHLVEKLVTNAPPRDREEERVKAKARNIRRFGVSGRG